MKKLLLPILLLANIAGNAQLPERIDSTFANNGAPMYSLHTDNNVMAEMAVDAQDHIVAVGTIDGAKDNMFILRVDKDGNLDTSFRGTGKFVYDHMKADGNDVAYSVDIQPDGKILVCGKTDGLNYTNGLVMRLHPDGTLDKTFSNDGWMVLNWVGLNNSSYKIRYHNNRILVACSGATVSKSFIYIAGLNMDGSFNSDFGAFMGYSLIDVDGNEKEVFRDFALTPNDGIVLIGTTNDGNKTYNFVQHLDSLGYIDNSFGNNGTYLYNSANSASLRKVDVAADGSIYIAGFENQPNGYAGLFMKLTANGAIDNAFASGNVKALFNPSGKTESKRFFDIKVLSDTAIVLTGNYIDENFVSQGLTVIYDSKGELNKNFAGKGYMSHVPQPGYVNTNFNSIVMQSGGKLVLGGSADDINIAKKQISLLRYKNVTVPGPASINTFSYTDDVSVFPNPSTGIMHIRAGSKVQSIMIYNASGICVARAGHKPDNTYLLDADMPNGMYYINIVTTQGSVIKKVLLNR